MISLRPPNAPTGSPPPITLPKQAQVRPNAEAGLGAAHAKSETGHDFIKDQQRAVVRGQFAQELQEPGFRQIKAGIGGHWLEDHAGDLTGVRREGREHGRRIVERHDDGVLGERGWNTRAVRMPEGQRTRPRADQERVGMPMITAVELDDLIAVAYSPGPGGSPTCRPRFPSCRGALFRGLGTAALIRWAIVTSSGFGTPKLVPRVAASRTASTIPGKACPRMAGPQVQT
jgi:hypothetical protein